MVNRHGREVSRQDWTWNSVKVPSSRRKLHMKSLGRVSTCYLILFQICASTRLFNLHHRLLGYRCRLSCWESNARNCSRTA